MDKLRIAPTGHHQQARDNQEMQVYGCIVDVIIPTNLVCVRFGPAILLHLSPSLCFKLVLETLSFSHLQNTCKGVCKY